MADDERSSEDEVTSAESGLSHEFGKFFGVYLLYCVNPKSRGRTYIGFTVNPNRRVRQHNAGRYAGGARSTAGKGPWDMTLIVHGFPSKIAALQFEWAWQNPTTSRRLRHRVPSRGRNEATYDHKLRILCLMLRTGPWCRLPLVLRWLRQEYARPLPADSQPPAHVSICYGPVLCVAAPPPAPISERQAEVKGSSTGCGLCANEIEAAQRLTCVIPTCRTNFHLFCLARSFLAVEPGQLLPVESECPACTTPILWGDLVNERTFVRSEEN